MSNNEIKWDFSAPMIMTSSCVTQPPLPSTIHFHHTINNDKTEVMRITREGVWVNPDMSADETAKAVLDALDSYIKVLVQNAVEAERESCAKVAESFDPHMRWSNYGVHIANKIRARSEQEQPR